LDVALPAGSYTVNVRALTSAGPGPFGLSTVANVAAYPSLPYAPIGLAVIARRASAELSWQPPPVLSGAAITGYRVSAFPVWPLTDPPVVTTVDPGVTDFTFATLTPGRWHFQVRALSAAGLGPQARVGATMILGTPPSPENVTVGENAHTVTVT